MSALLIVCFKLNLWWLVRCQFIQVNWRLDPSLRPNIGKAKKIFLLSNIYNTHRCPLVGEFQLFNTELMNCGCSQILNIILRWKPCLAIQHKDFYLYIIVVCKELNLCSSFRYWLSTILALRLDSWEWMCPLLLQWRAYIKIQCVWSWVHHDYSQVHKHVEINKWTN